MKNFDNLSSFRKAAFLLFVGLMASFAPLQSSAQCTSTLFLALGNGNDGEGIAFNPNDGLIYHTSGISIGNQFFEAVNPATLTVGPNLVPGNTYGPSAAQEISGMVWYPPMNAFIIMDRNDNIFSVTTAGVFTQISTFADSYLRGFAVVGTDIYGVDPFTGIAKRFNPTTGAVLSSIQLTESGNPVAQATGLSTQPGSGIVYIAFQLAGTRHIGTVDLFTGVITDLGSSGLAVAGLTFDSTGKMYAVTGNGGANPETLFSDFSCAPLPVAIPTMGQWGLILLSLLTLTLGVVTVMRRQMALAGSGNASVSMGTMPFDGRLFAKILPMVLAGFGGLFAVAVFAFGYEMTSADVPGSLLTAPMLAYLVHLFVGKSERA